MATRYSASDAPIGVVVALPAEARTLGPASPRNTIADLDGHAKVYVCGVGPGNARRATRALLSANVAGLVSWGTAGGLSPAAAAGSCVVPDGVIGPDAAFETDAQWCERIAASARSVPVHRGALYSCGELASATTAKARLHAETGAFAIDAESGAVAEVASRARVPFVCIRAVVDGADMTLPGFAVDGLDDQGFPSAAKMLAALLRRPAELAAVPGLLSSFNSARRTLANIRRDAGPRLLGP